MGRLDHVHIRVPDRAEAARWYAEKLGFEPVEATESGETVWRLAVAEAPEPTLPMQIIRPAGASGR
jgi:catechol 2,3-dioxygenase-like lactoylglutathione lyase family enzyme